MQLMCSLLSSTANPQTHHGPPERHYATPSAAGGPNPMEMDGEFLLYLKKFGEVHRSPNFSVHK